ncbi:MAG: TonB-dependent receptor, partial [Gemmatimonadaceae bacterium]
MLTLSRAIRRCGGAIALGVSASMSLAAQTTARIIHGVVTDAASGRAIAGADVVGNGGAVGMIRTDESGHWTLSLVDGAVTRVRVRHPGFAYRDVDLSARGDRRDTVHTALVPFALPLDAMIVTASRREQRLGDAVVETELIGERELKRNGASDLSSVLTERSGLQVDGGVPAGAGVQMRGFDSRRVLILLDGQPLVGRVNGNFDLSRLPTSMVERIEVVKGPQSTLYGSDALGGVINIITRRATRPGWEVGVATTAGTQGRRDMSANGIWRNGSLGGTIDGGIRRLDLTPGVAGDDDTFAHRWNAASSVRWQRDSVRSFEVGVLGIGEQQRYRTGQLFHFADNTQLAARVGGQYLLSNGRLSTTLHFSSFDHLSRASTFDHPVSDSGSNDAQRLMQGDVLYNGAFGRSQIDAGLQLRRESIAADRLSVASPNVSTIEPFAQATFTLGALSLTPGVRLTSSDRWGEFVAPRLAAMWRPASAVAIRASLGRGFRAPDFKELYLDFVNSSAGYAVRGNPDLRPESSTSGSLGVEWTGTRLWARAGAYRNDYRDFIETREPDASGTYTYSNIARGRTSGVELESGLALREWRLD